MLLHPLDVNAGLARPLIDIDPRGGVIPQVLLQHGALHRAHAPTTVGGSTEIALPHHGKV
jgi:hypothetical protein